MIGIVRPALRRPYTFVVLALLIMIIGPLAVVDAASGAVDMATGTTLIQLSVDNAAGELMPGGYASVGFELAQTPRCCECQRAR